MDVFCNPLNLPYRYQIHKKDSGEVYACREAADPSLICYRGKYYLFASMCCALFASDDLVNWETFPLPDSIPWYAYAPDVRVVDDWVWFIASSYGGAFADQFRTQDPIHGPYEKIEGTFGGVDPNRFQDTDGRVYFYWGCSDSEPIRGRELDRKTMTSISDPVALIQTDAQRRGYERRDPENRTRPYLEGSWMNKWGKTYYLQYAVPGTEFETYADGVFESESPLGPFRPARNNPYSFAPGSFCPGAGHGSTVDAPDGSIWHAATMRISLHHMFERRIGLFPAGVDRDGELFCNQRFPDWPMHVSKFRADPWADPDWMLLSSDAQVSATSEQPGHDAFHAVTEDIREDWTAASSSLDESLTVRLSEICSVFAVQINMGEGPKDVSHLSDKVRGDRYIDLSPKTTRWLLEGSADGIRWMTLCDKREVQTDLPHDLILFEDGKELQYIRISHISLPYGQIPCVSGLRIFGSGHGPKPDTARFSVRRSGPTEIVVDMDPAEGATGYVVLFGHRPDKLYHSTITYKTAGCRIGALTEGQDVFVRVDAFNHSGITRGHVQKIE